MKNGDWNGKSIDYNFYFRFQLSKKDEDLLTSWKKKLRLKKKAVFLLGEGKTIPSIKCTKLKCR